MRPLSERLQQESEAGWGDDLAGLLREAAALAKGYEDAEVVTLTSSEAYTIGWWPEGAGVSVRIIREPARRGG